MGFRSARWCVCVVALAGCPRGGPGPARADTHPGSTPEPASVDVELDGLIAAGWGEIEPAPPADDATFLRRVSLDLTGRIPTSALVEAFTADRSANKRQRLVDALLESEAYADHWAEVYTNVLFVGAARVRPWVREATRQWLEDRFAAGIGWDDVTREIIAADGELEGSGPQGFLLTHGQKRNVEAVTGHTARVFLGVRLECAQCHDHPTDDRYAREDFYALAAYFARTRARPKKQRPALLDRPRGEMRMPTATDPPGTRTGERVQPRFLGRVLPARPGQTRREVLAEAVIGSDLFAKAVVARTWARLFGHGVVPAADDLGGEGDASHPPLLVHLAERFVASGYDHADLLRTIVSSRAYQRASFAPGRTPEQERAAERVFAQAAVRPMDADQLFRSLLVATGVENVAGRRFRAQVDARKRRALREYRFVFADDENAETDAFSGNVPQALLLLNGRLVAFGASNVEGSTLAEILDETRSHARRIDALHLALYGRHATDEQIRGLRARVERDPAAYEDLMHAMLLSSEFLTIH
jgi:hypothetical protein